MVQILPAVLSKTEEQYVNDMNRLSSCEDLQDGWVHFDFADNIFVPNETIRPKVLKKFPNNFHKEAHLMVAHPKEWIDELADAGFARIIFHIESQDDIDEVIDYSRSEGMEVGLAIKMDTPLERLEPFVNKIDIVLVMSIVPGFQGQPFIVESLDRIREIKSKDWSIKIAVDGSVRDQNARELVEAGVDNLTVGSFLLKGNLDENLQKLWEVIHG